MRAFLAGAIFTVAAVGATANASAEMKQFTIDLAQSSISITPSTVLFGNPLPSAPQSPGSWTTSYSGAIDADVTPASIQLLGASLVAGISGKRRDDHGHGTWNRRGSE